MGIRNRLRDEEASAVGIQPLEHREGVRINPKYTITQDQWDSIREYRRTLNPNLVITGTSTLKDGEGNVKLEWIKTNTSTQEIISALRTVVDALKKDIKPIPKTPIPENINWNSKIINQYTLTDFHLGMMAWEPETGADWDLKIAEKTLIDFFKLSIEQSPKAESCIFAQIGDFLHWDGLDAVTPKHKNILDADTRFTKLVRTSIRVIRQVISMLLEKYNIVHVIMAEGNHDPASSVWLRELFSMYYDKEPRVRIDINPDPYYCMVFGKTCLFYHHGDKKNINNVDSVLVSKYKKEFGDSEFVYAHLGHLHALKVRESNLMVLEQHRTLATKDAYASRSGYMSGRDSKVITYHKDYGEVARSTVNIEMLK